MPRRSKKSKDKLKEILKRTLIVLVIIGLLAYITFGSHGLLKIIELKKREMYLNEQYEELSERKEALKDSLELLKKDTFLLEKIAREKLGMIKEGDTVIILEEN